jgi:hypothetical protein
VRSDPTLCLYPAYHNSSSSLGPRAPSPAMSAKREQMLELNTLQGHRTLRCSQRASEPPSGAAPLGTPGHPAVPVKSLSLESIGTT